MFVKVIGSYIQLSKLTWRTEVHKRFVLAKLLLKLDNQGIEHTNTRGEDDLKKDIKETSMIGPLI